MREHPRIEGRTNQTSFSFVGKQCHVLGKYKVCEAGRAVLVSFVERVVPESRPSYATTPRIKAMRETRPGGRPGCAYVVDSAFVPYDLLDSGVGTGLYEALAKFARSRGCRLMSSTYRSVFSEGFWKKQHTKGRARCADPDNSAEYYSPPLQDALRACERGRLSESVCDRIRKLEPPYNGRWKCGEWELSYPPPASLGRIGGRRRRRRT